MSNKEPGFVYLLRNPSFREDWVKIDKSSRPVDVRSKELIEESIFSIILPLFSENKNLPLSPKNIYTSTARSFSEALRLKLYEHLKV